MTQGTLGNKILLFAFPLALTGILQQLFNAADVAVIGRFVGKTAMAAVGSNTPVITLIVSLFVGVSLGANVVIARLTGQKDEEGVNRAVHTAIMIAVCGGVMMALIGELAAKSLLQLLAVPDDVLPLATLYLRIYFIGLPVILLYNFESAIFRSQGNTKTPLLCLAVSGLTNVALNLFFVIALDRSVDGVAAATVIANVVSSGLLFYFLRRSGSAIKVDIKKMKIDAAIMKEMFRIGLPAGLQGMVFAISNVCIQSAVNSLGSDVMAASSAAFNIEIFAYYIVNAFGQACSTFVGQNYGAGNIDRCRKSTSLCMLQDILITIGVTAFLLLMGKKLLTLFNSDPIVLEYGYIRIRYIVSLEVFNVVIEVLSGNMRGFGFSLAPALVALVGICGIRITWVYTYFRMHPSFDNLMIAYPLSWVVTAAAMVILYFSVRRHFEREILEQTGKTERRNYYG